MCLCQPPSPRWPLPAADIRAGLEGLKPFLDSLPSPAALRPDVLAVRGLLAGLLSLEAAAAGTASLPELLARAAALNASAAGVLRSTVPRLAAVLRGLQGSYLQAAPFMLRLLGRVAHVNDTVLELPAGLHGPVALLRRAKVRPPARHAAAGSVARAEGFRLRAAAVHVHG